MMDEEDARLEEARLCTAPWRKWGPYVSERQWGTVREDYSPFGTAWEYFPHDHARSRAYRWGEDGIAALSDDKQMICLSLCLWNGQDPILKERLFGLTGNEGNHGEDVKEYAFYLDNVPTHSYMKYLYKYPQNAFPYDDLVETNRKRNRNDPEYELLDTKIFDNDEYFDIFIEYAKAGPEDILIRYTIANRNAKPALLHLLPTILFRNTWSWKEGNGKPRLYLEDHQKNLKVISLKHPVLGSRWLYCHQAKTVLFTENETNMERLFQVPNHSPYVKDGINDTIVQGKKDAVNPENQGTKASAYYKLELGANKSAVVTLRLSDNGCLPDPFGVEFDALFVKRIKEADDFYAKISPFEIPEDMRNIQRQAFAGLLWNKQYYHFNVKRWIEGDPKQPPPPESRINGRNHHWPYLDANDIFSMPDKWEYPWFAAWDLAFHAVTIAMLDPEFAKKQLLLLNYEWYMSPNGQIPAYEWSFEDVNPPVQAWAAMRIYQIERARHGRTDRLFLEKVFQKLVLNFTWWVNRKDKAGRNVFEGGFLGLDNIGAFDRTLTPPAGGNLIEQDSTGWMGMYCLTMLQIALELALDDPAYEDMATKFFEHFIYIANAINDATGLKEGLWDYENGFYYSLLIQPDGKRIRLRQDNMAGIIPLFAVATNKAVVREKFPEFRKRFRWFIEKRPEMLKCISSLDKLETEGRLLLAFANPTKLSKALKKILDENQFLSPFGVRSVSKKHATEPFEIVLGGKKFCLDYEPGESTTCLFGGNSNWRGPIWFPLNFLFIESLQKFDYYYGDAFKVECPTGSGKEVSLWDVSIDLTHRLISIFLKDENGKRPLYGSCVKFQTDPHWRDYIHFHEYFHGDNGFGLGASNQTGWTALVAKLINQYAEYNLHKQAPRQPQTKEAK